MLDQFLASSGSDQPEADRGAFQLAWRPVGARPLSAALTEAVCLRTPAPRLPRPSFELLESA